MKKKDRKRNQKGFTLIEIIAVLVILGILAAVAVPRFINLTEQAEEKALDGALAAGKSTCSLQFGRLILSNNGTVPTSTEVATNATANSPAGDDFTWAFAPSGTNIVQITATNTNGRSSDTNWRMPQ